MDLFILASILFVLLFRLWDTLGSRDENEVKPRGVTHLQTLQEQQEKEDAAIRERIERKHAEEVRATQERRAPSPDEKKIYDRHEIFDEILKVNPQFSADEFLKGAKYAFSSILEAFSANALDKVVSLLEPHVFGSLREAMRERVSKKQRLETHIISVDDCKIEEASLKRGKIYLKVRFLSTQINTLYDAMGKIIEGDPQKMRKATDLWTFVKPLREADPNWMLADIHQVGHQVGHQAGHQAESQASGGK